MISELVEEKDVQCLFFEFLSLKEKQIENTGKNIKNNKIDLNINVNKYKSNNNVELETKKISNLRSNLNSNKLGNSLIKDRSKNINSKDNKNKNKKNDLNNNMDNNYSNNDNVNSNDNELRYEIELIFDKMGYCNEEDINDKVNPKKLKFYINFNIWEKEIVVELLGLGKFCSKTLYNMSLKYVDNNENYNIDTIKVEKESIENLLLNELNLIKGNTTFNYFKILCNLSESEDYIYPKGFRPLLLEIINRHLALKFLVNNITFKNLFINTIISRIYYELDLLELHKLRYKDIKNSSLMHLLKNMKGESFDDLIHYFSYQHFYVLYCRFIELDHDEDQHLSYKEFRNHDFGALSENASNRIWECNILGKKSIFEDQIIQDRKMSYYDFLYFYISDEDKTSERSIRYWFEIIDLDCDGWISNNEIEYFYNEQRKRSFELNYTIPEFNSVLCMMNDLLMPSTQGKFRLNDFQRNRFVAGNFFNILVNTKKCLSTIFMDGEFNTIHSLLEYKDGSKYYSPWDLHCQYQYQIIQDDNFQEN